MLCHLSVHQRVIYRFTDTTVAIPFIAYGIVIPSAEIEDVASKATLMKMFLWMQAVKILRGQDLLVYTPYLSFQHYGSVTILWVTMRSTSACLYVEDRIEIMLENSRAVLADLVKDSELFERYKAESGAGPDLTADELLGFFDLYVLPSSPTQRKISVHIEPEAHLSERSLVGDVLQRNKVFDMAAE